MRAEAEQLVLPRPFGRQIAKPHEAHAVRQSALDCGLDEIGREKGERDRHVDLAYATPLSICDAFGRCRCVGDEFVKPTPSACNRCDQPRSSLGAYGAYVLSRGSFGHEYLTPPRRQRRLPRNTQNVLTGNLMILRFLWLRELDNQLFPQNLDTRDMGIDECAVVDGLGQLAMLSDRTDD